MLAMEQTKIVWEDIAKALGMALPITILECQFQNEIYVLGANRQLWRVIYQQKYGRKWTYEIAVIEIEEKIVICPYITFQVKPEVVDQMVVNSMYAAIPIVTF